MTNRNYYLIRSPKALIENNSVGYGWAKVNFSKSTNVENLLIEIKAKYGTYGRKGNMIKRFFNLESNDVVIVPLHNSIAIGVVEGEKSYHDNPEKGYNRVSVDFKNDKGEIRKISTRTNILTNSLLSRLRIRQSNASLNSFSREIEELIKSNYSGNDYSKMMDQKLSESEEIFKTKLINNLRKGNNLRLKGGGDGFESLICELLKTEGFVTEILPKKATEGKGDIDIIATKDEFYGGITKLVIQAKHHKGKTSIKALNQVIIAIKGNESYESTVPIVISTGIFGDDTEIEAEDNNIILIDGQNFVNWLYKRLPELSIETQFNLGISQVPSILE